MIILRFSYIPHYSFDSKIMQIKVKKVNLKSVNMEI